MREMLIQANVKSFYARGSTIRKNINFSAFTSFTLLLFGIFSVRLMVDGSKIKHAIKMKIYSFN